MAKCGKRCNKCQWYFTIRNKKGKVWSHICWPFFDGLDLTMPDGDKCNYFEQNK